VKKKGATMIKKGMHRLTIDLEESLWRLVKIMCARRDIQYKHLVAGLLWEWVSDNRGKEDSSHE